MSELKPCPFCGGYEAYISHNYLGESFVRCPFCGAVLFGNDKTPLKTDREAVKAWNRRAYEQTD